MRGDDQERKGSTGDFSEEVKRLSRELTQSNLRIKDTIQELKQRVECLNHAAIVSETDAEGKINYVNNKFCEISKYSRNELIGQNHRILKSGLQPDGYFVGMWKAISLGKVWRGEIVNKAKDGTYYWVDTTIVPFYDVRGNIEKYVSIRFDITDQKESQEKLKRQEYLKQHALTLSARLSPHFIFNALNSIQDFILDREVEEGLDYVSKFASLMRQVLRNSSDPYISLSKEIEFLTVYLDIEKVRFNHRFDFIINVGEDIDLDEEEIPPMILQPYIENSIIHGFSDISYKGMIEIKIRKQGESLMCSITDNGIGREKASMNKTQSRGDSSRQSFSTRLIGERISILKELHDCEFTTEIIDKIDENGEPNGTEVRVNLSRPFDG